MSRYERFDRRRVILEDVAGRGHDLHVEGCLALGATAERYEHPLWADFVEQVKRARQAGRPVVLMMGAHPIKAGLSRFLVDLIERGWITHLATNGAGMIHDFELATLGGTSEDVARWIQTGRFGMWNQTSRINDLVAAAARSDEGIGEALGRTLVEEHAPHVELSLAAAGWRAGVPVTSHVGIGNDILHGHPNFDGAAWGKASDNDFLVFARTIQDLEGGVYINLGTAVMGPEVYLKALSMARNLARQQGQSIRHFTTAVFDLIDLPDNWQAGSPPKDQPQYYYRPWKTILLRTVADGGRSYYFRGDHRRTVPTLWADLKAGEAANR